MTMLMMIPVMMMMMYDDVDCPDPCVSLHYGGRLGLGLVLSIELKTASQPYKYTYIDSEKNN